MHLPAAGHTVCPKPVAKLRLRHALHPGEEGDHFIMPDAESDFGREDIHRAWGSIEQTISTHHLRFRCVMFENNPDEPHVNPLIYVRVLSSNSIALMHLDVNHLEHIITVSKHSGDVLLNHDDALQLSPNISLHFQTYIRGRHIDEPLSAVIQAETTRFTKQYLVMNRRLGAGGNASVYLAITQRSQTQVACKIVPLRTKTSSRSQDLSDASDRLAREYNLLKDLDHPNVVRLEKVFCAPHNIYIFQQLVTGGDLLSYLGLKGALSEPQAAAIVRQLLLAVDYLHDHQIVHRDIKPENILMTSWADGARVVLTDFGHSRAVVEEPQDTVNSAVVSRMQTFVGTRGYAAPEIYKQRQPDCKHDKGYSKAVDLWSVGCTTATMMVSNLTFAGEEVHYATTDPPESFDPNSQQQWNTDVMDEEEDWHDVGRKAKSFIRGCLVLDETQRLTAKQALLHDWFTNRHYAAELEAAYRRAIADWKPRDSSTNLIEVLDTTKTATVHAQENGPAEVSTQTTKSSYFAKPQLQKPPSLATYKMKALTAMGAPTQTQRSFCSSSFRPTHTPIPLPETLPNMPSFASHSPFNTVQHNTGRVGAQTSLGGFVPGTLPRFEDSLTQSIDAFGDSYA